jgi:hypothetical protein
MSASAPPVAWLSRVPVFYRRNGWTFDTIVQTAGLTTLDKRLAQADPPNHVRNA